MLTKTELVALWRRYDFRPTKRLGQNFLVDDNIKDKIVRNLELDSTDTVIEIGAGFGELTVELAGLAGKVFAVEKDKRIIQILGDSFKLPANVTLVQEDFLDMDISRMAPGGKVVIYGNIPYYATSPILEKIFEKISSVKRIFFVVQKELADRITALPGSRAIGRLSLYTQYYTEPAKIFKIGKDAFYPVPKVESVFLRLDPHKTKKIKVADEDAFFRVIKAAYAERRKTIHNSLAKLGLKKDILSNILKEAEIDPMSRPERLSLQDFAHLTDALCKHL